MLKFIFLLKTFSISAFIILCIPGCATQEEIQRRKLLKRLSQEMSGQQNITKRMLIRLSEIEDSLGLVSGKIEEKNHRDKTEKKLQTEKIKSNLSLMKEQIINQKNNLKNQNDNIANLQNKLRSQGKFITKVLSSLKNLKGSKGNKSPYNLAMRSYKQGHYNTARILLVKLLQNNKIRNKKRARIIHNLGMIAYIKKEYKEAEIYFSKLFTQYPKVGYNSNGLLYLGRTFKKLKKLDAAKQTWKILIKKYPKSTRAKQAKKLLRGL